mmetsp:Transcript_116773/g.310713  ORF Transcript_116773/g.310713 Transcript_116773/m.310713 type:complete len:206 (-) Transcript_116773:1082-1699(-)
MAPLQSPSTALNKQGNLIARPPARPAVRACVRARTRQQQGCTARRRYLLRADFRGGCLPPPPPSPLSTSRFLSARSASFSSSSQLMPDSSSEAGSDDSSSGSAEKSSSLSSPASLSSPSLAPDASKSLSSSSSSPLSEAALPTNQGSQPPFSMKSPVSLLTSFSTIAHCMFMEQLYHTAWMSPSQRLIVSMLPVGIVVMRTGSCS